MAGSPCEKMMADLEYLSIVREKPSESRNPSRSNSVDNFAAFVDLRTAISVDNTPEPRQSAHCLHGEMRVRKKAELGEWRKS
jgi:hypothetical protein